MGCAYLDGKFGLTIYVSGQKCYDLKYFSKKTIGWWSTGVEARGLGDTNQSKQRLRVSSTTVVVGRNNNPKSRTKIPFMR